MSVEELKELKK
jgi:hypothetical protein